MSRFLGLTVEPRGQAVAEPAPLSDSQPAEKADEKADEPLHRKVARYAWALLLARIYEVLPLLCSNCGGELRIIAFITEATAKTYHVAALNLLPFMKAYAKHH